jgi:hypothetical protein
MCNATAALAMQGAGAASSALGAYYGAQSSKATLNFNADLADINARVAESAAQASLLTGEREEQRSMISTANLKGTQRASLAANGVDLGEGSAANILTTTDVMGEADANTIHANAIRQAFGYRTQSVNQSNQAMMSRASASAIDPLTAGATSLLGSAGQVAGNWYRYSLNQPIDTPDPRAGVRGSRGY